MLGPYATWGLAGAGAGLLFYFFAGGKSGGPIAIPGSGSKLLPSFIIHSTF